MPEGEAFFTFYERIRKELENVIQQTPEDNTVLLVTHNGVMSAMLCVLTGAGYDGFWRFFLVQETYSLVSVRNGFITIEKIIYCIHTGSLHEIAPMAQNFASEELCGKFVNVLSLLYEMDEIEYNHHLYLVSEENNSERDM